MGCDESLRAGQTRLRADTPCSALPQLFINNKFVDAKSGATLQTLNPASGEKLADVAAAQPKVVDLAVAAARRAFDTGPWPRMTGKVRLVDNTNQPKNRPTKGLHDTPLPARHSVVHTAAVALACDFLHLILASERSLPLSCSCAGSSSACSLHTTCCVSFKLRRISGRWHACVNAGTGPEAAQMGRQVAHVHTRDRPAGEPGERSSRQCFTRF